MHRRRGGDAVFQPDARSRSSRAPPPRASAAAHAVPPVEVTTPPVVCRGVVAMIWVVICTASECARRFARHRPPPSAAPPPATASPTTEGVQRSAARDAGGHRALCHAHGHTVSGGPRPAALPVPREHERLRGSPNYPMLTRVARELAGETNIRGCNVAAYGSRGMVLASSRTTCRASA